MILTRWLVRWEAFFPLARSRGWLILDSGPWLFGWLAGLVRRDVALLLLGGILAISVRLARRLHLVLVVHNAMVANVRHRVGILHQAQRFRVIGDRRKLTLGLFEVRVVRNLQKRNNNPEVCKQYRRLLVTTKENLPHSASPYCQPDACFQECPRW